MDKQLLIDAENEIKSLRRQNEILAAKVEVMDLFAGVLHTSPACRQRGASPDVAWQLRNKIDELTAKEKAIKQMIVAREVNRLRRYGRKAGAS